ncbi:hypothetical protein AgCh_023097 [Apium graveolens]
MHTSVEGGVSACRGLHSSFRPTQGGLSLNLDVSTTMILTPGPAKKMLRNMRFKATHSNREFKIKGLSEKPCNELYFTLKKKPRDIGTRGEVKPKQIIVYEYFRRHLNLELRTSAYFPCLDVVMVFLESSSNIVGGGIGGGKFTSPIGGTSSRNLSSGIGGGIVGGEVRANLSRVIGGNFNTGSDSIDDDNISSGFGGIDGDIGRGALISAIASIGSSNFSRRISGGIVGVGVEVRASLRSSIHGHFNDGITGGTIDGILVSLSSCIGGGIGGNIAGSFSGGKASCHSYSISGILVSLNSGNGGSITGSLSGNIGDGMAGSFSGSTSYMYGNIRSGGIGGSSLNMNGGAEAGDVLPKSSSGSPRSSENDFLNMFFNHIYKPIPLAYNLVLAMLWHHPENVELDEVKVVHYCAAPWRYTGKEANMDREDIKMLVSKCWDIYNDESLDFKAKNSAQEGENCSRSSVMASIQEHAISYVPAQLTA